MKKSIVFLIVFLNVLLLTFYSYKQEEKKKELIVKSVDSIKSMSNNCEKIVKKNRLLVNMNKEIDSAFVSLKKDEYEILTEKINKIEYEDIKEKLELRMDSLLDSIEKEEERLLKYTSIENLRGNVTAFTAFCSDGCNGYTASGRYVGDSIYYNDKDYGKVRIVAADRSYPFGTIVRFNNLNYFGEEVFAIVLDRGGAIGKNKRALFDLLFDTEKKANDFGIARGVSCDILRLGY